MQSIHCMGDFFTFFAIFMMLWTIVVYCPLAHCTWPPEGLFGMMHVHDYAGGISWIKGHHASKT